MIKGFEGKVMLDRYGFFVVYVKDNLVKNVNQVFKTSKHLR